MRKRLSAICAALMIVILAPLVSASPASAATCKTASHAYLISLPSGTPYFSGYDGNVSNVPVWTTRKDERFQFGGNGIKPGTSIKWSATNRNTGESIPVQQWDRTAGSNCVVNQGPTPPFLVTASPGVYELRAEFTGGNTGMPYNQLELIANVVP